MDDRDGTFDVTQAALSLWGKSTDYGADRPHLLLQHLYDTLAVGELIWDEYLGGPVCAALDEVTQGRGRRLFTFLCGVHDVGKATPKFQAKSASLAQRVRDNGLTWNGDLTVQPKQWHHTLAGAYIIRTITPQAGWPRWATDWIWPLVGGHHGVVPPGAWLFRPPRDGSHGESPHWPTVQRWLLDTVAEAAGYASLEDVAPMAVPTPGVQLAVSGSIIMADWLASSSENFEPVDSADQVSVTAARSRARSAWQELDLRSGVARHDVPDDLMPARFGRPARPLQTLVERAARRMPAAGLMLIEAPMGEGKTEAALVAAEILIERFGLRGLYVGMPTQATSDPMFTRVHDWTTQVAPDSPIILLHGKRRFNEEFEKLRQRQITAPIYDDEDTFGVTGDQYGIAGRERGSSEVVDWFLKNKRGLLSPIAIGTIDNLLHAGTRSPHVMLRHTGLAQKVVILDEVHAATVYMAEFLKESLRWLGSTGVPVIVLTATLPPALRRELGQAYLGGADVALGQLPVAGYPSVTTVVSVDGDPVIDVADCEAWRPAQQVSVQLLSGQSGSPGAVADDDDGSLIASQLRVLLADGGVALVIRNTVDRAQQTFTTLDREFPGEVEILHARLMVGERAERTERELRLLGSSDLTGSRTRHILVATQVAEQSFDIDADVLITDLAPIDLLLQRAGRVHRHERGARPAAVSHPAVYVTGLSVDALSEVDGSVGWGVPEFPPGAKAIYGPYSLIRAAAFVLEATDGAGWTLPGDIPRLVASGYDLDSPSSVTPWPYALDVTLVDHRERIARSRHDATTYRLVEEDRPLPPLLGQLNKDGQLAGYGDEQLNAIVRDGERSVEALLIRRDTDGTELTLSGRRLSDGGAVIDDVNALSEAIASVVRLPAGATKGRSDAEIDAALPIPDAWRGHAWLRFMRALVLDDAHEADVFKHRFRYDQRLGLVDLRRWPTAPAPAGPTATDHTNHG